MLQSAPSGTRSFRSQAWRRAPAHLIMRERYHTENERNQRAEDRWRHMLPGEREGGIRPPLQASLRRRAGMRRQQGLAFGWSRDGLALTEHAQPDAERHRHLYEADDEHVDPSALDCRGDGLAFAREAILQASVW